MSAAAAPPAGQDGVLAGLLREPGRFSFDAAITLLLASATTPPGEALRFETAVGLAPAFRDVLAVRGERQRFTVRIGFSGLVGPGGVLPRPYSELAAEERRRRSPALGGFLDMLAQRFLIQYALAGAKYHPTRSALLADRDVLPWLPPEPGERHQPRRGDRFVDALLALTGHGLPGDLERSGLGAAQLLYFSGLFASRPRSADRLGALLEEWLDVPVAIEQFVGSWQTLEAGERSRLGAAHSRLDRDAAAGVRVWDIQTRIRIRIGPLDLAGFEALLPGRRRLQQLQRLVRTYLDDEAAFAVNLVLRGDAVPPARLTSVRLGFTGWLPAARSPRPDAADTVLLDGAA